MKFKEEGVDIKPYFFDNIRKDLLYEASRNGNIKMMELIIDNRYPLNQESMNIAMLRGVRKQ